MAFQVRDLYFTHCSSFPFPFFFFSYFVDASLAFLIIIVSFPDPLDFSRSESNASSAREDIKTTSVASQEMASLLLNQNILPPTVQV
jgi:hypothetical protein